MKRSSDRILTTHTGLLYLPGTTMRMAAEGHPKDPEEAKRTIRALVDRQIEIGIDVISHGDVGGWVSPTSFNGFEMVPVTPGGPPARGRTREMEGRFREHYSAAPMWRNAEATTRLACTGPISPKDTSALESTIKTLKDAVAGRKDDEDLFLCIRSPQWLRLWVANEYYPTTEAYAFAIAEGLRPYYKAVVDAGMILQIDDPNFVDAWAWDQYDDVSEYRKRAELWTEALNHALEGLPQGQVREHICWGSWHGPHTNEIPLRDVLDILFRINAQAYSIEAAKPNHLHEWKVLRDIKLPEGKIIVPGVVDHTTPVVEHPEVVADRIINYANLVGRENVIASTDCGFRLDAEVCWAKYESIVQGAALASKALWQS